MRCKFIKVAIPSAVLAMFYLEFTEYQRISHSSFRIFEYVNK